MSGGLKGKSYKELYTASKGSKLRGLGEGKVKRGIIELVKEDRFGEFDVEFRGVGEAELKKGMRLFEVEREVNR